MPLNVINVIRAVPLKLLVNNRLITRDRRLICTVWNALLPAVSSASMDPQFVGRVLIDAFATKLPPFVAIFFQLVRTLVHPYARST